MFHSLITPNPCDKIAEVRAPCATILGVVARSPKGAVRKLSGICEGAYDPTGQALLRVRPVSHRRGGTVASARRGTRAARPKGVRHPPGARQKSRACSWEGNANTGTVAGHLRGREQSQIQHLTVEKGPRRRRRRALHRNPSPARISLYGAGSGARRGNRHPDRGALSVARGNRGRGPREQ